MAGLANGTLHQELRSEARALARRIQAQTEQAHRLRSLAARIEDQTLKDSAALCDLEEVLGEADQLGLSDLDERLGGQRLERIAIRLLTEHVGADAEIHYRDWYALLADEGHEVAGKNPLGTFLAQLNRSDAVERIGTRTGRYRLCVVA